MTRDYNKIFKNIRLNGFFSEYLPPCFSLKEKMFSEIPQANCDLIKPYSFTMSRFNINNARRTIFIPEIGAYAVVNDYVKDNNILEELTKFIDTNSESFSKLIMEDGSIMRHEQVYDKSLLEGEKISSQYINNVVEKTIKSAGAKKVLKIDIANCFASIYTHFIPAILLGYDIAEDNYKRTLKKEPTNNTYDKYKKLDDAIRKQNTNQTNGLLVGPLLSQLIVEALLTRIDIELKEKDILFSRYLDDYEVYLFEKSKDEIISIFVSILRKYGLSLNFEKIELIDFPYYVVENFDRIIEYYRKNRVEDYDLVKLFNDFFEMEKSGTKGAIRYLLKSIERKPIQFDNKKLFNSYILTIMANDSRSLTKACSLLINNHPRYSIDENYIKCIKRLLHVNIEKSYDLEVVWLLYVLIETNNIAKDDEIVHSILSSKNDLAKIMILRNKLTTDVKDILDNASSWILNYELYANDNLDEKDLCNRLSLDKNIDMYRKLKENELHFCY